MNSYQIPAFFLLHVTTSVLFGNNHLFVLHHPKDKDLLAKKEAAQKDGKPFADTEQTYDKAQEEIAQNSGLLNYGDLTERDTDKSAGIYYGADIEMQ